jgi:predicted membrane chloride channel (bestrophin family)
MPPALHVESLDKMKKTILVIIVVSLSVFLLKENMLNVDGYVWTDLFVPLSIVAIAVAIKLIGFED